MSMSLYKNLYFSSVAQEQGHNLFYPFDVDCLGIRSWLNIFQWRPQVSTKISRTSLSLF